MDHPSALKKPDFMKEDRDGPCSCPQKYPVPRCCSRYLADIEGREVHTQTVCYTLTPEGKLDQILTPVTFEVPDDLIQENS